MSTLYVTEFTQVGSSGHSSNHYLAAPSADSINAYQAIAIGTASAPSAATNAKTKFVKLISDTNCWLAYGAAGIVATHSNDYLPAGVVYYVGISPGTVIAAIT